jgi:hypothetical protein
MSTIEIKVPKADEYKIDDFLGNIIMYKVQDNWNYLHGVDLPLQDLKILEVKNLENEACLTIQVL